VGFKLYNVLQLVGNSSGFI